MRRFLFIIGLILLVISLTGVAILSTRGVTTVTWEADLGAPPGERVQETALEGQAAARSLGKRLFDSPAQGPAVALIAALGGALVVALALALAIALWRAGRVWRWLIVGGGTLLIVGVASGILVNSGMLGSGSLSSDMAEFNARATQIAAWEPLEEAPAEEAEEPIEEEMEEEEPMAEPTEAAALDTSTPPAADEPSAEPTVEAVEVTPPDEPEPAEAPAYVEVEWPERMGRDDSGVVRIQLERRVEGDTLEVTVEVPGNVGEATLVEVPEGATGSSLEDAFGPDYRALAAANLESTGFDVWRSSARAAYQPLSREQVQWVWFIEPLREGEHTMVATVTGLWEPVDEPEACTQGSDSCIERELWYAILETRVRNPLIETGQLNFLSIVTGVLGSSVSIPWLVERVQGVFGRKSGGGG